MNPGSASPARGDGHPQAPVLWLVPSRGRPTNVARLHAAFTELGAGTEVGPWSDVVYIIDADDPELDGYLANGVPHAHYCVRHPSLPGVVPPKRMGAILNDAWTVYGMAHSYAAVGFMGDDHLPRTPQFDARLMGELIPQDGFPHDDLFGVAWGDDLLMGDAFPTAGLLGAGMLDAMGYMVPPEFKHLCIDVVWSDIAKAIGRRHYRPDVIIEHVHPAAGKAELDAGYTANNDTATVEHDSVEFGRWSSGNRMTDFRPTVARIMEALGG